MPKLEKKLLAISGMTCASCVSVLEKALRSVPGVSRVDVSLAAEEAKVEFDPALTRISQLVEAVAAQGYAALPRYILQPVSDLGRPGKSLVGPAESNKTKTTLIIAVGYGGSAQASVMLQSTYILPF